MNFKIFKMKKRNRKPDMSDWDNPRTGTVRLEEAQIQEEKLKKEKHKWKKIKMYLNIFGDPNHHHIIEGYECSICGAKR